MKQLILILFLFSLCHHAAAQTIENRIYRWAKGDIFSVATGYRAPIYGRNGKSLTDPLMGYAHQGLVFMPMISSEVRKGFGIDARFTYLQSNRWVGEIERNLRYENLDAFTAVYTSSRKMRIWSIMLGPSYRIKKGKNMLIANLLGGIGNQPIKSISADVKDKGSNDLVTWRIIEAPDLSGNSIKLYTNIYIVSGGLKVVHQFHDQWGAVFSCDLFYSQRKGRLDVIRTNQVDGSSSGYSIAPPTSTGWMVTPGVGVFLIVN